MPRNILISGAASLLGSYLVAHCLTSSDTVVHCLTSQNTSLFAEELASSVQEIMGQTPFAAIPAMIKDQFRARLCTVRHNSDHGDLALADVLSEAMPLAEVWCLPPGRFSDQHLYEVDHAQRILGLLAALREIGKPEFNYVTCLSIDSGSEAHTVSLEQNVAKQCKVHDVGYRIFRMSLILGESAVSADTCRDGFLQFLGALHEISTEIKERAPDYFEFQALRCWAPDTDMELNMVAVQHAADLILRIARGEDTLNSEYIIAGPENKTFADICDMVGMAYDLNLLPTQDRQAMNAIDRTFHERLGGFYSHCVPVSRLAIESTYHAAGAVPEQGRIEEKTQQTMFKAIRSGQDAAYAARNQRLSDLPSFLEKKTVQRDGFDLVYYVGGSGGTALVFLNALGQGLQYWRRLIGDLMRYHQVVIWESRGTDFPPPPFGLKDQVEDLDMILQHEKISACHLVGWCTGPKVAIDFYLQGPEAVISMVFLNSTFKCFGSSAELDTDYERNFEPLCRVLEKHPSMAPSIMKSLQSGEQEDVNLLDETDSEQLSKRVLALMNNALKPHVRAPFQSTTRVVNYARQVLDFWSCDTITKAAQVKIPVLLVSSEYDQVASPAMSRMAARLFPRVSHVHVQDATHYCLYDRPHFIAELMERFFQNSNSLSALDAEASEIIQTA